MTSIPVFFSSGSQDTWQRVCHSALLKLFSITLRKQSPLWQLIHCWYICYSFTYDATPITKMRLCYRSSWCENILFSAKICMIKVKRLYANLLEQLNPLPPPRNTPTPSFSPLLGGGDDVLKTRLTESTMCDHLYVMEFPNRNFLHFLRPEVTIKNNTVIVIKDVHLPK